MGMHTNVTTHMDPSPEDYYIAWVEMLYGILLLTCFAVGTVGNACSLSYFAPRAKYPSALTYSFITMNDVITSILMLPMALSYFYTRTPLMFDNPVFCDVWGILWNMVVRYSIFLVALLTITRTTLLYFPFKKIRRQHILISLLTYLTVLLIQALVPFYHHKRYIYYPEYVQCFSLLGELFEANSAELIIDYTIFIQLEYIIPLFPILISCYLSAKVLRSITVQGHEKTLVARRRTATVTIMLFTMLYAVFNIPAVLFEIVGAVDMYTNNKYNFFWFDVGHRYFRNMITVLSIGFNAACNPLLYFWRMRSIRRSVQMTLKSMSLVTLGSLNEGRRQVSPPVPRIRNLTVSEL